MVGFDTAVIQMTKMSQRPKFLSKIMTKMSQQKITCLTMCSRLFSWSSFIHVEPENTNYQGTTGSHTILKRH